jgi:hypothetical protein
MEIIATNEGKTFTLTPAGNYVARCYSMIHLGTLQEEYKGEKKELNKVRITWELPTETHVFNEEKGEQPFSISKEFTLSLHEKATLRKFLESWRGKGFTEEEAKRFDISKLLGVPCMINIIHKVSEKSGNKYADIASISAMPKGLSCPEAVNSKIIFSITQPDWDTYELLPDFIKDKIKSSIEFKALQNPGNTETPISHEDPADDIPF